MFQKKIIGVNVQIKSQMKRNPIKVIQVSTNVAVKRPHLSGLCHHGCKAWKHWYFHIEMQDFTTLCVRAPSINENSFLVNKSLCQKIWDILGKEDELFHIFFHWLSATAETFRIWSDLSRWLFGTLGAPKVSWETQHHWLSRGGRADTVGI